MSNIFPTVNIYERTLKPPEGVKIRFFYILPTVKTVG